MYCSNCGKQIADSAVICVNCGVATKNMESYQQRQPPVQIPQQVTVVNTNTNTTGYAPRPVYVPVRKKSSAGLIIAIILFLLLSFAAAGEQIAEEQEATDNSASTSETVSNE